MEQGHKSPKQLFEHRQRIARHVADLEAEALEGCFYTGHGWAIRNVNGDRYYVAASHRQPGDVRYGVRFGYVVKSGYICNREEFASHLARLLQEA